METVVVNPSCTPFFSAELILDKLRLRQSSCKNGAHDGFRVKRGGNLEFKGVAEFLGEGFLDSGAFWDN